jgi:hypothetical protein
VSPHTLDLGELVPPRTLPILAAALVQMTIGLRRQDAWRCSFGAACLVAAALTATRQIGAGSHQGPIAFHLILAAVLLVGAVFDDRLGQFLRTTGAAVALLGSLVVVTRQVERTITIPSWAIEVYPLVMSLMIAGYGLVLGHRISLASAGLILSAWLAAAGCRGYNSLRQAVAGIDYIAIGMVMFSVAVLTSMAKGGVLPWRTAEQSGKVPDA